MLKSLSSRMIFLISFVGLCNHSIQSMHMAMAMLCSSKHENTPTDDPALYPLSVIHEPSPRTSSKTSPVTLKKSCDPFYWVDRHDLWKFHDTLASYCTEQRKLLPLYWHIFEKPLDKSHLNMIRFLFDRDVLKELKTPKARVDGVRTYALKLQGFLQRSYCHERALQQECSMVDAYTAIANNDTTGFNNQLSHKTTSLRLKTSSCYSLDVFEFALLIRRFTIANMFLHHVREDSAMNFRTRYPLSQQTPMELLSHYGTLTEEESLEVAAIRIKIDDHEARFTNDQEGII